MSRHCQAAGRDSTAIDLLTAATTAYASTQKSSDLLSVLSSIFDEAA